MLKNQLKQNIISADKIDGTFDSIELTEDIIFIKNRYFFIWMDILFLLF